MNNSFRFETLYLAVALASMLLLASQHWAMNETLPIYPAEKKQAVLLNDSISGGRSIGEIEIADGAIHLNCQTLHSPYTFAFCGFVIPLQEDGQSVDLSHFTHLDVWLELEPQNLDTVLFYLRNSEISKDLQEIKRSNVRALVPLPGMRHYSLPLDSFSVPSWWLFANKNARGNGETDFSNVSDLLVSTGDNAFERQETIKIKRVELNGKWLKTETVNLVILVVWIVVIFCHILLGLLRLSSNLNNARQIAKELESVNKMLCIENDKYESMAKVDPLTGAYNRAGVRDVLDQAVLQLTKHKVPCSIIMFDIDHFKSVNDQYGHDVGDQILVDLVAYIQQHTREQDSLARWGGEEFVLICQKTKLEDAIKIANKFCADIAQGDFLTPHITCSFGVSEIYSGALPVYFKKADIALYKAKGLGRNQVVSG